VIERLARLPQNVMHDRRRAAAARSASRPRLAAQLVVAAILAFAIEARLVAARDALQQGASACFPFAGRV
jgi:hypothetical protein